MQISCTTCLSGGAALRFFPQLDESATQGPRPEEKRHMARKESILLLSTLFVFGVATQSDAQTLISNARRIDWTQAGITGGIPYRKTICATLSPGATFTQINSAIAACNNGVVFLNPGTYTLAGGIVFNNKSNVTLRGA